MKRPQVQGRWRKYARAQQALLEADPNAQLDTVLVITTSEDRLKDLLDWSEEIADVACFITLDDLIADPFGRVWRQIGQAKRVKLIDPVGKGVGKVLETC